MSQNIIEIKHPVISHKLGFLRDENTSSHEFRSILSEISYYLAVEATRDQSGFTVERLQAESAAVTADARVRLSSDASSARAEIALRDTGVIADGFPGPVNVVVEAQGRDEVWSVTSEASGPGLRAGGITEVDLSGQIIAASGPFRVALDEIAPLSSRLGREVSGGLTSTPSRPEDSLRRRFPSGQFSS